MRRFSFVTSWQLFLSTSLCDYCLKEKQTKKISPKLMGNGLKFTLTWIKSVDVDAQQQTPVQFAGKWETRHEQGHLLRKARIEMKWIDLGAVFERTMLKDSMEEIKHSTDVQALTSKVRHRIPRVYTYETQLCTEPNQSCFCVLVILSSRLTAHASDSCNNGILLSISASHLVLFKSFRCFSSRAEQGNMLEQCPNHCDHLWQTAPRPNRYTASPEGWRK